MVRNEQILSYFTCIKYYRNLLFFHSQFSQQEKRKKGKAFPVHVMKNIMQAEVLLQSFLTSPRE